MKFGIVVFPGSNCDHDCFYVLDRVLAQETVYLWHRNQDLEGCECVVLPGGFSYGDYLRTGAIARFSPIMESIASFARAGGLVLGICNGFQVLVETGLLPGALLPNRQGLFICRPAHLRVENINTPFTNLFVPGEVVSIPIAHQQGNYFVSRETLAGLERNGHVLFRYCGPDGQIADRWNPNGSMSAAAGILSREGNILGMMPHPERSSEDILGSRDGRRVFLSIINWFENKRNGENR
ncbi:MAG TPA: phosphoribosylformylglycinamidine synthase subunit PurQ [Atribacteraceae bacterium]|nr:phosphoribosylformylglycinamidine synthase subunit PurQ [Atribacteraceae bacterium]